jgi:type IV pilus assembly protein PilV
MKPRSIFGQRGFNLVEVLIAVLVLSAGMLGLAGLQVAGMKSGYSAYLRSQAAFAAYDLLERMRANPSDFAGRVLKYESETDVDGFEDWKDLLDSIGLPSPTLEALESRAFVDCTGENACGAGNCEVVVRWDDSRGEHKKEANAAGRPSDPLDFFVGAAVAADEGPSRGELVQKLELRVCSRLPE